MKLLLILCLLAIVACQTSKKSVKHDWNKEPIVSTGYPHPIICKAVGSFVDIDTVKKH